MTPDILRGLRLKKLADESVEYTASTSFDGILLTPVVKINTAHMVMLVKQDIVDKAQGVLCLKGLKQIPQDMHLDPALEDIHMGVEAFLSEKIGRTAGGQLNLAKSRNDQVSTAIRMALRDYLLQIISGITEVQTVILDKAAEHLDTVMPGYTHLQHAQPTTLAHHLIAYYDALRRDGERLKEAYERVNRSPLGAAALASTGVKIDRGLTARLLGFDGLVENTMDAVSSRDFAVEVVSNLALTMTDMSRVAEELVLWSSGEFGVVEISDGYASTSSIMPQKKNAVVAELIRGKSSTVYGDLVATVSMMKALPYSYNIDMQQLTPHVWSACEITLSSLQVLAGMLSEAVFDAERLEELLGGGFIMATDLADYLAVEQGIPFRTAHMIVGNLVRISLEEKKTFREVILKDLSKMVKEAADREIQVSPEDVDHILDPRRSVESRCTAGGPSRVTVMKMIGSRRGGVAETVKWLSDRRRMLEVADGELNKSVDELIGGEAI